jgi:hypothetical protein
LLYRLLGGLGSTEWDGCSELLWPISACIFLLFSIVHILSYICLYMPYYLFVVK